MAAFLAFSACSCLVRRLALYVRTRLPPRGPAPAADVDHLRSGGVENGRSSTHRVENHNATSSGPSKHGERVLQGRDINFILGVTPASC